MPFVINSFLLLEILYNVLIEKSIDIKFIQNVIIQLVYKKLVKKNEYLSN